MLSPPIYYLSHIYLLGLISGYLVSLEGTPHIPMLMCGVNHDNESVDSLTQKI